MKIVLAGGSGHLGTMLARAFITDGHDVVVLSRSVPQTQEVPWRTVRWDAVTGGDWQKEIDGADAVINLTGRSVNCRYTLENRKAILESRVNSTKAIGRAIGIVARPPRVWLQMSTATIYAHTYGTPNDENGPLGGTEPGVPEAWRFSVDVARDWETALHQSETPRTRKVLLRAAMVMGEGKDGAFDVLAGLAKRGLGGRAGDGKQYMSWIHQTDFVRAIYWLLEHEVSGPVNLAAPTPLPQEAFMADLRHACGAGLGLPAPRALLGLATFFMDTESELVLKSRRVVPGLLLKNGFTFEYPSWPEAAADLCARRKAKA